ncbi:MAG: carboxypeptidase-like regulatory domain-containing protein, partial [Acidobacteriota bacterium]|nr:carboxypeptidase-like regulatory domain-containing protein [Acidobacteriota bacterium]
MKRVLVVYLLLLCSLAAQVPQPGLRGTVTDPSGASVSGALVQVIGPGGQQRTATGSDGQYSLVGLSPGKYRVRFIAKGFSVGEKPDVEVAGPATLDYQFTLQATAQVINVDEEANSVSVDPAQNGDAIVIKESQIDALSDDPDVLQQQLLALAGPGAGPNGGAIYVDGFSGAQLPPKASIQEIRINSNPYSPENEFAGGGGIQIITKPGMSTLHGSLNTFFNKEALNSRSPVLTESKRPQLKQERLFGTLSGMLKKNKASWSLNFSKNALTENAFIYATTLDTNLNPVPVNQTVLTPRGNWNWQPRIDYAINSKHSFTASYFNGHNHALNQGVGDFSLPSRAYLNLGGNDQLQLSETAILSTRMVSDTRFQWLR